MIKTKTAVTNYLIRNGAPRDLKLIKDSQSYWFASKDYKLLECINISKFEIKSHEWWDGKYNSCLSSHIKRKEDK